MNQELKWLSIPLHFGMFWTILGNYLGNSCGPVAIFVCVCVCVYVYTHLTTHSPERHTYSIVPGIAISYCGNSGNTVLLLLTIPFPYLSGMDIWIWYSKWKFVDSIQKSDRRPSGSLQIVNMESWCLIIWTVFALN